MRRSFGLLETPVLQNIKKFERGPFGDKKIQQKVAQCRKKTEWHPADPSGFANTRKNFRLKHGLEPATAGFPLNRLKTVQKSGTDKVSSVV